MDCEGIGWVDSATVANEDASKTMPAMTNSRQCLPLKPQANHAR